MKTEKNNILRRLAVLLTVILAVSAMAGCAKGTEEPAAEEAAVTEEAAEETAEPEEAEPAEEAAETEETAGLREFTDDCGRTVEIPAKITSIVPASNVAQMYLIAAAPDQMKALASEVSPLEAQYFGDKFEALPVVGALYGKGDLNTEELAKTAPEVAIDIGEPKDGIVEDLDDITERTGIQIVHIDAMWGELDHTFEKLGELLGDEAATKALADYCAQADDTCAAVMKQVDAGDLRKSVVYCTGEDGLSVLANGTFHAEVLDQFTDNIAVIDNPSGKGTGSEVNIEQLLTWNPEAIIFAPESYYASAADDALWQPLTAVKDGAYYEVPNGPYNWMGNPPACNRVIGAYWLLQTLYPEIANLDMQELTKQYYELFYHYDLSDDEYHALVGNSLEK